ncbi:MAG: multidrug ABC transporter ATPase [Pseudolysinimonas sp.]
MAKNTRVPLNRIERVLAFALGSVVGLSVLSIIALLIGGLNRVDTSSGIWLTVKVLPAIALPVALVLLLVFIVLTAVRRNRLARDAS